MKLGGQGERGYAMASLLVAMALMAIFMSVALPAWSQMAQREKEAEYLFRANQYALAVARCRLKQCGANGFAPSVDFLVAQRFLRKKYKDPITDKDFVPVFNNQALPGGSQQSGQAGQTTGQPTGQQGQPGRPGQPSQQSQQSSLATAKSLATDTLRVSADTPGGSDSARPLTGVTSSSKATALRLFKGQATTYDQWAVTVNDLGLRLGGSSVGSRFVAAGGTGTPQQPGQPQPGQQGQNPFGQGGNSTFRPMGTPPPGGGSGFGSPNQQGTPVFPQQPFGGGMGQKPPSSPFGSKPPL